MNLEPSEDNVGQCELKHFDKLKAAELKAFIIARHPKYIMLSDVGHLKNTRGGKSMEEASNGVENCISLLMVCIMRRVAWLNSMRDWMLLLS